MSKDTIYREDAINVLEKLSACEEYGVEVGTDEETYIGKYEAITAISDLPSADRPQGEWIRTGRTNIYGGIEVQCSNCGDKVMVQHIEDEWYCRHCGADMGMKGADDETAQGT